ncbi:hypothetical protein QOT17_017046 [Balamuthia mandrillaris]
MQAPQAENVGMDKVIESVADAVSQLVVFALEAESNDTVLPNVAKGCEAVRVTVNGLIDVVEDMARKFGDEPHIQSKMNDTAGKIKAETSRLTNAAQSISKNQFDQQAKKQLMQTAKEVLQGTVQELHLADKYDVLKIIKAAEACQQDVRATGVVVTRVQQVTDVAKSISAKAVELVKLVNARIRMLPDPIMKSRLTDAVQILRTGISDLVRAMGEVLKYPGDAQVQGRQRQLAEMVTGALNEIVEVAKLSCKTLFDALDFDIGEPSSAEFYNVVNAAAGLQLAHSKLLEGINRLDDAAAKRLAQEAAKALQMINGALAAARRIAETCEDPALKEKLLNAISNLERIQQQLVPLVKAALAGDKDALRKLQQLLDEARRYADDIAEVARWEELRAAAAAVDDSIDRLGAALDKGDRVGARAAANDLKRNLQRELELLEELEGLVKDEYWKKRLADIRKRLAELKPLFDRAVEDAIANPQDRAARARLDDITNNIKEANADLRNAFPGKFGQAPPTPAPQPTSRALTGDAMIDAANKVHDALDLKGEFDESTPEGRVYAASRRVAEEMIKLSEAANKGDKKTAIECARKIADYVKDLNRNTNEIAGKCKDPILRDQVLSVAGAVVNMSVQLKVITAVKAGSAENDPTIKAQLVRCAEGLASNLVNTCNAVEIAGIRY